MTVPDPYRRDSIYESTKDQYYISYKWHNIWYTLRKKRKMLEENKEGRARYPFFCYFLGDREQYKI